MTTCLDQSLCFCKHPFRCENVTEHILNGKVSELVFKIMEYDPCKHQPLMYFICGNHYNVLIDTGSGNGDISELVVINTSNRYCHTGGNCFFATDNGHVAQGVKDVVSSLFPFKEMHTAFCRNCSNDNLGNYMPSYTLDVYETLAWLESSSYMEYIPYKPTLWVGDRHVIKLGNDPDNYVLILQTPGPTPDSQCIWYPRDRRLFVGDFLHRWKPLLAVSDYSNLHQYEASARKLLAFVRAQEGPETVRLSCGHHDDNANVLPLLDYFVHMLSEINRGRARGKPVSSAYEGFMHESRDYRLVVMERRHGAGAFFLALFHHCSIKLLVGVVSPTAREEYLNRKKMAEQMHTYEAAYASSQLGESLHDRDNVDDTISHLGLGDDIVMAPGETESILAGQLKKQLSMTHLADTDSRKSKKSSKSKKSKKTIKSDKDKLEKVNETQEEHTKKTESNETEKAGPSGLGDESKSDRIVNGISQDTTTESAMS